MAKLAKAPRKGLKISTSRMVKEMGRHYLADKPKAARGMVATGTKVERTVVKRRAARKKKP